MLTTFCIFKKKKKKNCDSFHFLIQFVLLKNIMKIKFLCIYLIKPFILINFIYEDGRLLTFKDKTEDEKARLRKAEIRLVLVERIVRVKVHLYENT